MAYWSFEREHFVDAPPWKALPVPVGTLLVSSPLAPLATERDVSSTYVEEFSSLVRSTSVGEYSKHRRLYFWDSEVFELPSWYKLIRVPCHTIV
eukprot:scaffold5017_cov171-Amphora_coffeaeformis.AAC.26